MCKSDAPSDTTNCSRSDIEYDIKFFLVAHRRTDDFLGRRQAGENLADAVFAQRPHAHLTRPRPQHRGRRAVVNQLPRLIVNDKNFEDAKPPAVAGVVAIVAAEAFHQRRPLQHFRRDAEGAHFHVGRHIGRGAFLADFTDEALGHEAARGRRHQKRLHADVHETRDRAGRVVRVERGENQMAGERGVDGDGRRFEIANFPDHHDVRCLAEDRAQRGREREPDLLADLHLVDAGQHIFHRVFHRDDFFVRPVYVMQAGIQRRRLAGTGRTRDEQNTVRHRDQPFKRRLVIRKKSEFGQTELQTFLVQNTHHDALAVVRRQAGHA
jgi:hypothetical protein